jgi:hypothetical protein
MFIRQLTLTILLMGYIAGPSTLSAQNTDDKNGREYTDESYSMASLNGEFALVGSYTGGIARQLGVVRVDNGQMTGFLRVNVPGSTPTQRTVVYLTFTGSGTIDQNGAAVISLTVMYPDGSLHLATLDSLITKATERRGIKIATEIEYMQRETPALSPGSLIVGTLTRRP